MLVDSKSKRRKIGDSVAAGGYFLICVFLLLLLLLLQLMRGDLSTFKRCWKIWVKEEVDYTFMI